MNIGDIVTLKSGGPKMTVEAAHFEQPVNVVWFDGAQVLRAAFPAAILNVEEAA